MLTKIALLFALTFVSHVAPHGIVRELQADGQTCNGYNPNYHPDSLAGCMYKIPSVTDNGYVDHNNYGTRDMICHKGAQSDKYVLKVKAGSLITGTYTKWPESHHGPIIDSLAKCDGDCRESDLTKLKFDVISHKGLIHPRPGVPDGTFISDTAAGYWALDEFREAGSIIKFVVPKCLKAGNYIWRHEHIALHSAMPEAKSKGAQHYPYCTNLEIIGDGTEELVGGSSPMNWYSTDNPGITINVFRNPTKYIIPGPDVTPLCGANDQPSTRDDNTTPTTRSTIPAATTTTSSPETTDNPAMTTIPAPPFQNVTTTATPTVTPTPIPSGDDTSADKTDNTDNKDKNENKGTPTPNTQNNGMPIPNTYNTDNAGNTDKKDNVVTPSSSTPVKDLIEKIQRGLDELRKALNIPSSKVMRRHAREVVLSS